MNDLDTKSYISSIRTIVEHITRAELTKQGYKLIMNYLQETSNEAFSVSARYAITKYTSEELPSLEEIRARHKQTGITTLDDLILRMEFEAEKLEKLRE